MGRLRRLVAPLVLALVTASSGVLALSVPDAQRSRLAGLSTPRAGVLSVRRVPDLLTRTMADVRLARSLDAALADPAARSSCLVARSADGRPLYSHNPDQPLIPASNLKLLLALGVLTAIGPEETFVTAAKSTAAPDGAGVVDGPLYLVGGGDPLLETADYAPTRRFPTAIRTPFERLADDLVAKGLRRVKGGVLADESRYDQRRYIPTWRPNYITDGQVGPQAALLVNDGFAAFQPGRVAAPQPAVHAAALLSDLLRGRGVSIDGAPGQSRVPASAASISELRSPPVREVVAEMLKESDNTTAELLVKELGVRRKGTGSTAAGLDALREVLAGIGLPVGGTGGAALAMVDGSGLDRSDRATCGLLLEALARVDLYESLPTAATDGTLTDRFLGRVSAGRLRAKTGSLNGVVGLSGYADRDLSFAFLANDLPRDAAGRALQEAIGDILVRYPDAPDPATLAP